MATRKVKPTEKQKKFVEEKLKGKSNRRAALDAGYSENTATNAVPDILEKPGTIEYFRQCMDEAGIKPMDVVKVLQEGLYADKSDMTGDIHPDHKVRLDFAKYINELRGIKPADKHEITGKDGEALTINVVDSFK